MIKNFIEKVFLHSSRTTNKNQTSEDYYKEPFGSKIKNLFISKFNILQAKLESFKIELKDFNKHPLWYISHHLYEFCRLKQRKALKIVSVLFFVFIIFLAIKNFSNTKITVEQVGNNIFEGTTINSTFSKVVSLLVDIATLPVLLLTILFSAYSSSENAQYQENQDAKLNSLNNTLNQLTKQTGNKKLNFGNINISEVHFPHSNPLQNIKDKPPEHTNSTSKQDFKKSSGFYNKRNHKRKG